MSKEVKRFNINNFGGAIVSRGADCVLAADYDALLAERDRLSSALADARMLFVRDTDELIAEREAAQKDAERMAFIEEHPNWLRKHKKHWQCVNPFTNYEYPVFKTAREAIDAALQG